MKLNALDLNKLMVFHVVARHGGYRGASEELNLTRSAISQSITGLEDSLGQRLFHRVGSRLRLTESAQVLQQELGVHQAGLRETLLRFTRQNESIEGQLRIGAYLEFTKTKLMPVIEEFMSGHPQVQMKFVFDSPSRLKTLLEKDKIDLSISIFPHEKIRSIESKKLYQEELVLIARTDLIGRQPAPGALMNIPVVDYYPSHLLFRRWWKHQFTGLPKDLNVVAYAGTAEMVYEMVRRRIGVGVVPRYILDAHKDDKIHIIQPTERRLFDSIWISQFKRKDRPAVHAEFLKLLQRRFV